MLVQLFSATNHILWLKHKNKHYIIFIIVLKMANNSLVYLIADLVFLYIYTSYTFVQAKFLNNKRLSLFDTVIRRETVGRKNRISGKLCAFI